MQARAKGLQTQVAEQAEQLSVLKRELTQKNQDMHELQLITAAWMGSGAGGGKAAGGGGGGSLRSPIDASAGKGAGAAAEKGSAEVVQRVLRGCSAGVAPASVTLFFSKDPASTAPAGSPPSYADLMVTPYAGPSGAEMAGGGGEFVCHTLASQLGVGEEALVTVFSEEATDEGGQQLTAVALLVLASNHLLQAHGRYQVAFYLPPTTTNPASST